LSILAGSVVLAGALAATRFRRIYEAMILKAIGATRGTVARTFAVEYALLGAAAGVIGTGLAVVLAWGVDVPVLHLEGAPTHMLWWSVPDMGAFDKVLAAFEAAERKWAEEYAKLADEARRKRQAAPKPVLEKLMEMADLNRHRDWLFRTLVANFTTAAPPADAKPYGWITMLHVKPGKGTEFRQLFDRYAKPTYDRLVADGVIIGYELGIEEARSTDAFTHYVWLVLPDLAAREKVRNTLMALNESRPPEAREAIEHLFLSTVDPAATRTFIQRTIYLKLAPPK